MINNLRKWISLALLIPTSIITHKANAQIYSTNTATIKHKLQKLQTTGTVLYIAAHPDDENTKLLAYLANERKLRTGYLSLTRGDGGQNLIGKEQGPLLGLIRTQELLAARKVDGAEQFFTRAYDFGFSKSPEETFQFWNKDSILADVVWIIRQFKPDVIICRFPTTGEGGHGHHTASAILAVEAFKAAADPKRFPEQLAYTQTWQATRIFWNTFNFGTVNTISDEQLKIDVGSFNPLLGQSYGEIAADSRTMHKSQGFGTAKTRGVAFEYFKHLDGSLAKKDLFDGIDQSWHRMPSLKAIQTQLELINKQFILENPSASISSLSRVYKSLQAIKSSDPYVHYWQTQKLKEIQQSLLACAGWWTEAIISDPITVPSNSSQVQLQWLKRYNSSLKVTHIKLNSKDTIITQALETNTPSQAKWTINIDPKSPYSTPYWLQLPHEKGAFDIPNKQQIGLPENEAAISAIFDIAIGDITFPVVVPVQHKVTDPVKGEVYRPSEILPIATINPIEQVAVFRNTQSKKIKFSVKANQPNLKGSLQLHTPDGWVTEIANPHFELKQKGDEVTLEASLYPGQSAAASGILQASILIDGKAYNKAIRRIQYDHIPSQFTLEDATLKVIKVDLKKDGNYIGYIPGAGDDVVTCLQQVGYEVDILDEELLTQKDLEAYDAIITGVRAYNTQTYLSKMHKKLMNYVKQGGNLIVQYNTNNRISSVPTAIGPYPFETTRDRVTEENAQIKLLDKAHPILHYPNKIGDTDFDGWVQERGVYFGKDSSNKYQKPIAMHDHGEADLNGSLLVAPYGKGHFVYTGLAFFRQLPAGVPGAYRLFTNILSLPRNQSSK